MRYSMVILRKKLTETWYVNEKTLVKVECYISFEKSLNGLSTTIQPKIYRFRERVK